MADTLKRIFNETKNVIGGQPPQKEDAPLKYLTKSFVFRSAESEEDNYDVETYADFFSSSSSVIALSAINLFRKNCLTENIFLCFKFSPCL